MSIPTYLFNPKYGITSISLNIGEPNDNNINPNNSIILNVSFPPMTLIPNSFNDNIQTKTVLDVSIVDLAIHDAYLVTDTPNVL